MNLDSTQVAVNECFKCKHKVEDHEDGFCNGSIGCMCSQYILPALANLLSIIEQVKKEFKKISQRCRWMLEHIPPLRNAGEKSFWKAYIWIWHGFKITDKNPPKLDYQTWKQLPNADTCNRAKRKVKQHNDELKTYDPITKFHQGGLYQAFMEIAMDGRDDI